MLKIVLISLTLVLLFALILCGFLIIKAYDVIEDQNQEIAALETKIMFLENNDCSLAIQQLPPKIQSEIRAINEMVKQRKFK